MGLFLILHKHKFIAAKGAIIRKLIVTLKDFLGMKVNFYKWYLT